MIWNTLLTAILSAVGAFIPLLFLMYVHYRIRRRFYYKIKPYINSDIERLKKRNEKETGYAKQIYTKAGVNDFLELLSRDWRGYSIEANELIDFARQTEKQISESQLQLAIKESDLHYIENYSFVRYLIGIVNDRFPDQYFRTDKK